MPSDRAVDREAPVDLLGRFYTFLTEVDQALSLGMFADMPVQDSGTRRVIALVQRPGPVFDDSSVPRPMRRLLEKALPGPWILGRLKHGVGEADDPRFATGLLELVLLPIDYTKTLRLFEVFRRYPREELTVFQRLLDTECDALRHSYFSDDGYKPWRLANVGVTIALGAAWSALLSTLLGADVAATLGKYIAGLVRESLVVQIIVWVVFLAGLLGIWLWSVRRYSNRRQIHRLVRAQGCLALFLESAVTTESSHRTL